MFKKLILKRREKSADKIVEHIVDALAQRNYAKISEFINLGNWSISDVEECAEGFKSINNLEYFDEFKVPCSFKPRYEYNQLRYYHWDSGDGMTCEYDLTTNKEINDLTLIIDFTFEKKIMKAIFRDLHVL